MYRVAATEAARWARACDRHVKAVGVRARAERTENMDAMSVTLDVSKFSGWLNADATCRGARGGRGERGRHAGPGEWLGGVGGGVAAAQAACRERARCGGLLARGSTR